MSDPKFKRGDEVYFLLEKRADGNYYSLDWSENTDGKIIVRGRVVEYLPGGSIYVVVIAEPYELYGWRNAHHERELSKNPPGIKPEIVSESVSVPAMPQLTDKEKMMKILGAPSKSEIGPPCPVCGTPMKPLGPLSCYCPNEDKHKKAQEEVFGYE